MNLNFSDATSSGGDANNQTQLTTHTESSNNSKYMNTLTGGITNKTTARSASHTVAINGESSAGLYLSKLHSFVTGQFAVEVNTPGVAATATTSSTGSAGIYAVDDVDLQAHYIKLTGSNNVGVYPAKYNNTSQDAVIYLGAGSIELNGGNNNTGIVVKDNQGRVYSESEMVMEGGQNNTAIYASGHTNGTATTNDVEVQSIETETNLKKIVFLFILRMDQR